MVSLLLQLRWVIDQGIEPGMQIVVEGVQRLRKGAKVTAEPYQPSAKPSVASASQDD